VDRNLSPSRPIFVGLYGNETLLKSQTRVFTKRTENGVIALQILMLY